MAEDLRRIEGALALEEGRMWYEVVGEKKGIPLIVLHGGPGYPHDYLEALEDLTDERQVVFYDQLGCGNSDVTTDPSLWTPERFVAQLGALIKALAFEKYFLFGHSWGAALAALHALTKPQGLAGLVLSDPYLSTPVWVEDAQRLISILPQDMQDALLTKPVESPEFSEASKEYYARFVRRFEPAPESAKRSSKKMNREMYAYMWGPKEFHPTGTLLSFDLLSRLPEITPPVLLVSGRYDEATPEALEQFKKLIPNSKVAIFEDSAHYPFWGERSRYIEIIRTFLSSSI